MKKLNNNAHWITFSTILLSLGVALVFLFLLSQFRIYNEGLGQQQLLIRYAERLQNELDRATFSVEVLSSLAREPELTDTRFSRIAGALHRNLSGTLSLQLAPNGIVSYIYPSTTDAGRLDNNLFENPVTAQSAANTLRVKTLTVDGPRELQQNGKGMVVRNPIFLGGQFWGFATAVFRLEQLFERSALYELDANGLDYNILVVVDGQLQSKVFSNSIELNQPNALVSSVVIGNQQWLILGIPRTSPWPFYLDLFDLVSALLCMFFVAVVTLRIAHFIAQRGQLHSQVVKRDTVIRHQEVTLNQAQKVAQIGSWHRYSGSDVRILSEQAMFLLKAASEKQNLKAFKHQLEPKYRPLFDDFLAHNGDNGLTVEYQANTSAGLKSFREVQEYDEKKQLFVGILQDVTDQKNNQALLWHQTNIDAVTKLANTDYARLQVKDFINQQSDQSLSFVLLDVVQFRTIHDALGKKIGNKLLRCIAARFTEGFPDAICVARHNHDVFLVIFPSLIDANELTSRVQALFSLPVYFESAHRSVEFFISLAQVNSALQGFDISVRDAEIALHTAKLRERPGICVTFEPDQLDMLQSLDRLDDELKLAVANRQLFMVYQPIIDICSGRMVGVEALVRWQHPNRGVVYPGEFIPRAEATGLIFELGNLVLHLVEQDVAQLASMASSPLAVSINISRAQIFDESFATNLKESILTKVLPRQSLILEITESFELTRDIDLTELVASSSHKDVKWALDDFGTGYSSYSALKNLPFDNIKVDRSFVAALDEDPRNQIILFDIVHMAQSLGKTVTVEGVETSEQFDIVRRSRCEFAQGYYFSRPVSLSKIASLVDCNWKRDLV